MDGNPHQIDEGLIQKALGSSGLGVVGSITPSTTIQQGYRYILNRVGYFKNKEIEEVIRDFKKLCENIKNNQPIPPPPPDTMNPDLPSTTLPEKQTESFNRVNIFNHFNKLTEEVNKDSLHYKEFEDKARNVQTVRELFTAGTEATGGVRFDLSNESSKYAVSMFNVLQALYDSFPEYFQVTEGTKHLKDETKGIDLSNAPKYPEVMNTLSKDPSDIFTRVRKFMDKLYLQFASTNPDITQASVKRSKNVGQSTDYERHRKAVNFYRAVPQLYTALKERAIATSVDPKDRTKYAKMFNQFQIRPEFENRPKCQPLNSDGTIKDLNCFVDVMYAELVKAARSNTGVNPVSIVERFLTVHKGKMMIRSEVQELNNESVLGEDRKPRDYDPGFIGQHSQSTFIDTPYRYTQRATTGDEQTGGAPASPTQVKNFHSEVVKHFVKTGLVVYTDPAIYEKQFNKKGLVTNILKKTWNAWATAANNGDTAGTFR